MALTPEQEQILADRYGVKRRTEGRRRNQIAAAIAGVAILTFGTWWFSVSNFNPVSAEVVSFQVSNQWQMRVEIEVSAPIGTELSCDLQALDSSFGVVAHKTVSLTASTDSVARYAVDMRTTATAVTAVVEICRTK